jgi:phosphomevalonate kinase
MTGVGHGKLVLVGEYAVLDGAPAIVAAVDHGVRCRWSPGSPQIVTPNDDRFARAALAAVDAPDGVWTFEDQRSTQTSGKVGFGGSAAAVVAAVRCALAVTGASWSDEQLFSSCADVHHRVQGSGSGIDVAAATFGGVLRFQAGAVTRLQVRPRFIVVYAGTSAATGPRVARYLAAPDRAAFIAESQAVVDAFAESPIAATEGAYRALCAMSRAAGLDWETPEIARLRALAVALGGAAKPSGAGGGDAVVAFLPDLAAEAEYERRVRAEGFTVVQAGLVG